MRSTINLVDQDTARAGVREERVRYPGRNLTEQSLDLAA